MEVTHEQLKEILIKCYKQSVACDVKGYPGIGKSELIKETAADINKNIEKRQFVEWNSIYEHQKIDTLDNIENVFIFADLRLPQHDPTDLKGLPKLDDKFVKWLPTLLFKVLSKPKARGIVFFDEMNLSPPSVTAACLQIIQDHQIGETPINKRIMFVSAGNRLGDRASVFEESSTMKTRRSNYTLLPPDIDAWSNWAMKHDVDLRIIVFLKWKETNLFRFDKDSKELTFPCPRTWKKASDLIQDIPTEEHHDFIRLCVGGCVGESTAREFVAFLRLSEKVNIKELLKNPKLIRKFQGREHIDMKYSIILGVAELYTKDYSILNDALGLCKYLEPEFGMFMIKRIKDFYKGKNFGLVLKNCSNFPAVAEQFTDYVM